MIRQIWIIALTGSSPHATTFLEGRGEVVMLYLTAVLAVVAMVLVAAMTVAARMPGLDDDF